MNLKNITEYKNIKFFSPDIESGYYKTLFKLHKKLYYLCKRHGATLDLETSDNDIYIENASYKLFCSIKKNKQYYNSKILHHGCKFWKNNIIRIW